MPWIESLLLPLGGVLLLVALPFMTRQRLAGRVALAGGWCVLWLSLTGLADRDLLPKLPYEPAMRLQAEAQYKELCSECHAEDGRGNGPQAEAFELEVRDLTSVEVWQEISVEEMKQAIRDGKGQDMPAFGRELNQEELKAIMTGFTEQLGVKCTFCHELGDYDNDDKEHKQVARKMITLVDHMRQNYDTYFAEGTEDNQTGCWTRHRGEAEIEGYSPEEEDEDWL
jgi:mono/diheme cytochrome c family protein